MRRAFPSYWIVFPFCFFLTLMLVTAVVPVIAQQPTLPNLGKMVQQPSTTTELLQQGKQRYQAGKFFEAATLWEQAAQAYASKGEILNQAQALNYLSLAYQDLGQWEKAGGAIAKSLTLLQRFKELEPKGVAILAQALNDRGSLELAKGQPEAALESWKQAEAAYDRARNETGKLGSRINQAHALQALGQYRRAKTLLEQLVEELHSSPDSQLKVEGLQSLGIALQVSGDLLKSKEILEQSWAISQKIDANTDTSATLLGIGNIARDLQQYEVSRAYYQEAQNRAPNTLILVEAQLNQLRLLIETKQWDAASALAPIIESNLSNLSPSRASVYNRVNLAESLMDLGNSAGGSLPIPNSQKIAQILATAVQQARQLSDSRAEAYSLTQLGKLYKQTQQWNEAKRLTEQALQISQRIDGADITARAAGQLGRILQHQKDTTRAIEAYRIAFNNLQSLRSDLVAINRDVQFTFKESVEPVYRELVSLLLQPNASQSDLIQARAVIEALQVAELDNFFGDSCLNKKPVQIDQIDSQAAIVYPIILSDAIGDSDNSRLAVILSIPNQPLRYYATQLSSQEIEKTLENFYSSLFPAYSNEERLQISEQIYDWLIKPAEIDLARHNIKTLVFVPDGFLRNLPMSALYDGKQYLVEKYSVAVSPGLQLFAQGLKSKDSSLLAAALTEARQGFTALPAVKGEIQRISAEVKAKLLLNQQFTSNSFQKAIENQSFPIVHLATHGQFSSNPEETFLLTWDDRINVKDLDLLFQKSKLGLVKPIELLVMSACQTASGDKRAALGLAGFALRSGARSTMASLWSVNDESTAKLMIEFYRQLTQKDHHMTKAQALRQAQLIVLQNPLYKHPYFWASFVLVGNWL